MASRASSIPSRYGNNEVRAYFDLDERQAALVGLNSLPRFRLRPSIRGRQSGAGQIRRRTPLATRKTDKSYGLGYTLTPLTAHIGCEHINYNAVILRTA